MLKNNRALAAIFMIIFVDILALTLVLPYLPFFAEHFGASPTQVGLIITVFAFCQFLSGPVLGRMSDQMGRKPILILSQIGTCVGFIILALAQSLWMVYFARILDGITAGNITVAQAAISDVTQPKERTKAFSMIGIAFATGFFIGPAISGLLLHFGPQGPAWGAAFLSLGSIITTATLFKDNAEIHHDKQPFQITWSTFAEGINLKPMVKYLSLPRLKELLYQFFFFNVSFSAYISCFALFAEYRLTYNGHAFGVREVGYLYAYLGFLGIIIRSFLIDRLLNRFGEKTTSRIGFIAQGLGYCSFCFVYSIPSVLIAATFGAIGSGLVRPCLASLTSREVGPREQGSLFGVSQSLAAIASIIAPMIAGFLIGHASLNAWALFAGLSILFALMIRMPASPEHSQNQAPSA